MSPFSITRRRTAAFLLSVAVIAATSVAWAEPGEPRLASGDARELWLKGSDLILAGDFAAALPALERVERIEPGNREVVSAISWMKEAKSLEASRERLRSRTFDYYVGKAKEMIVEAKEAPTKKAKSDKTAKEDSKTDKSAKAKVKAKVKRPPSDEMDEEADVGLDDEEDDVDKDSPGYKWSRALSYALGAMYNAKSEDEFREEKWLDEIVEHVLAEIESHRGKNEWSDALVLYSYLKTLYPDETKYSDGYKFCAKRAHLDFVYGPKSNWRTDLRDVTPSSIGQILDRMDEDYVTEPDFKKLCSEGLDHLTLLAEAKSISETFPTLSDDDRVSHFAARLQGLKRNRVEPRASLRAKDVTSLFNRVLAANRESGLNLPESVLVDEFVSGMLEPLDEFTSVIWPAEVEEFNKHTRGEFVGVGIQITQDIGKHIRVETPLEDSPAYKAGIKPGDMILEVDGKSTLEMTINQAVTFITGEAGSRVKLTIKDPVTEVTRDYSLVRQQIKLRTVRGHTRDDGRPTGWDFIIDPERKIGYVRVSGFMDKTVEDLEAALEQLRDDDCNGLILDLRFNPGGLLTSAVKMCELFLGEDEPIVKTKGRSRQQNMEITSKHPNRDGDLPLIILVNEYSASASEIVAGALSGLKQACIVGTRSFGKGSVQNLIPIADNRAYLKLTTAHYYVYDSDLPGDPWYCLHHLDGAKEWGVEPHVVVDVIPQETSKILRLRRERDLLKGKGGESIPEEVLDRRPTSQPDDEKLPEDENPDVDPQLDVALNLMRVKLISNQPWAMPPRQVRTAARVGGKTLDKESVSR